MDARLIAVLLILPFGAVFIYAAIHEFRRYKSQGTAKYGLVYDEHTGTTHLTGIPTDEDGYDHTEFDPSDHNDRKIDGETEGDNKA